MISINNVPIDVTMFPDNTSQVWKLPKSVLERTFVVIQWNFSNEGEILQLAQLKDLLDDNNIESYLYIEYLPYARQDKEVSNTTTFALHSFAKILNAMKFKNITIQDAHSDKAFELIENSIQVYPMSQLESAIAKTNTNLFCYPDKGALKKYSTVYNEFIIPYIYGEKVRDQLTGNITSYSLIGNCLNKNVLIVDDICDGGATFVNLAKELYEKGANEVNLFVTHGLFTKGVRSVKQTGIKRIFDEFGEVHDRNGFSQL